MPPPSGFTYRVHGDTVVISHHGKPVTTLRAEAAESFRSDVEGQDDDEVQGIMARATGNYRRGNERLARRHPRNR
jgi:hypothetical protein